MVEVAKFYGKKVRVRFNRGAKQLVAEGLLAPSKDAGVSICVTFGDEQDVRIEDAAIVEIEELGK